MRKIAYILAASALVSLVSACVKETPAEQKTILPPIQFYAEGIGTKTAFAAPNQEGDYPTTWTANDAKVKISANLTAPVYYDVTPVLPDYESAKFENPSAAFPAVSAPYTFYAYSPASAFNTFQASKKYWQLTIPASQTALSGSPAENAMLLAATSDSFEEAPGSVSFQFHHLTAYGRLSLTRLSLADGETPTSVTITAPSNWVGAWKFFVADDDQDHHAGDWVADTGASNTLLVNTSSLSNIFFACAPSAFGGETLTIVLSTNLGTYTREDVTLPEGKNFVAGGVLGFSVRMDTADFAEHATYNLVEDSDDLTVGSEVIIVAADANYALGAQNAIHYREQVAISKETSIVNSPSSRVTVFTLGQGDGNHYSFKSGDYYLYASGGSSNNYLDEKTALDGTSTWKIGIGTPTTVTSTASGTRINMRYNSTYTRFSCYASGQGAVAIYKKADTGDDSQIISVIDVPAALNVKMGATNAYVGATTNSTASVTYATVDSSVATVASDGKITPVAVGSCNITCSVVASGNYTAASATVAVTVAPAETWQETAITSLTSSDVFVIVGNKSGDTYALTNDNGSSDPATSSVSIDNGLITSAVGNNLKWKIGGDAGNGYVFYSNSDTTTWLYVNGSGLRVGKTTSATISKVSYSNTNKFTLSNDILINYGYSSAYVGIKGDATIWKYYASNSSLLVTVKFYKLVTE